MPHEDIFLDYRTGKAVAVYVCVIQVVEVDGKFLSRAFSDTNNHLRCDMQADVSYACSTYYLLETDEFFSHFLFGKRSTWLWFADERFTSRLLAWFCLRRLEVGEETPFYRLLFHCLLLFFYRHLADGSPVDVSLLQFTES